MRTVQLAIRDTSFARRLQALLSEDESCNVVINRQPDFELDGVILTEEETFDALHPPAVEGDRLVVVAHRNSLGLERMWNAGIHHVVFDGDSPTTVYLAIVAALLRTASQYETFVPFDPNWADMGAAASPSSIGSAPRRPRHL